jgi:hypothetical protein
VLQFAIEHFVDQELKATLNNKRVDREHQQPNEGGEGESRGSATGFSAWLLFLD